MAEGPVTTEQTGREECGETTDEDGAPAKVHTRIAADTLHLANRRAWRAIAAALADAGVTNRGAGEAARQVWAERQDAAPGSKSGATTLGAIADALAAWRSHSAWWQVAHNNGAEHPATRLMRGSG